MKKLLLFSISFFTSVLSLVAQPILNKDFENWSVLSYEDPNTWSNSNSDNVRHGLPVNVTKVAGVSGNGIRLETIVSGSDTSFAFISNSMGDPIAGQGGLPYSDVPTAIEGSFRYNLGVTDTAIMVVIFKKDGLKINENFFKIRGTGSQLTFVPFSFSLSLSATPDTVIIAAASSNAIAKVGVEVGSFIEFDDLAFTGPGVTQPIIDGDFENWTTVSKDILTGWYTQNEGVSKVSPGYTGNFAVQMITLDHGDGVNGSGIATGKSGQNGPIGGLPFTNQIDTLCGYYKYSTSGNDSGQVYVNTSLNGFSIGGNGLKFTQSANWSYFELPIMNGIAPDTIFVGFNSSINWPIDQSTAGSTLIVDNLYFKSEIALPTGIKGIANNFDAVLNTYPNPATETIKLSCSKSVAENAVVKIYSITGNLVYYEKINAADFSRPIDVSKFAKGTYSVVVQSNLNIYRTKFMKQ
jgi:hypothetical protein